MSAPASVRQFFQTVLQLVYHFKVDVIAGDANAAAYRFFKKQDYQDLYNSSVAVMLREREIETQPEVNTGRPFESRLHVDHYSNNHFLSVQKVILIVAFMAILSW